MDTGDLLSPDGYLEPPSEELLQLMLELPLSDRRELAEILAEAALALKKRTSRPQDS